MMELIMKKKFIVLFVLLLLAVFGSTAMAAEKTAKLTIAGCGS
jgi:hypothetical protein